MKRATSLLLLVACACNEPGGAPPATDRPRPLATEARTPATPSARRPHPGHIALVVPRYEVDVKTLVAGRIVELPVALGEHVEAGEALAVLENVDLRHALRMAEASRGASQARLADARHSRDFSRDRARQAELLSTHISADELAQRQHELRRTGAVQSAVQGDLGAQRAQLDRLREQLDALTLCAPFAAEVAAKYRDPGQSVLADEAIVRLVSTEQLVRFAVDDGDVADFPVGAAIEFADDVRRATVPGTVVAVAPEVDSANMVLIEAAIAAETSMQHLRSGSQGRVRVAAKP